MARTQTGWTDEQVEQVIGNLLRVGVLASALVVLGGGVHYLVEHGAEHVKDRHVFHPPPPELSTPGAIVREALALHSRGLIHFGLLLLIATPVARVLFSAFAFALQRDYLYVAITLFVLAILLYSLLSGHLS
jgi:uncharacterized membrane protein